MPPQKRAGLSSFQRFFQYAEPWAPSTASAAVLSSAPEWGLLLERVGDTLFMQLLRHTSVFLHLGQANYLQATGRSVLEVSDEVGGKVQRA